MAPDRAREILEGLASCLRWILIMLGLREQAQGLLVRHVVSIARFLLLSASANEYRSNNVECKYEPNSW